MTKLISLYALFKQNMNEVRVYTHNMHMFYRIKPLPLANKKQHKLIKIKKVLYVCALKICIYKPSIIFFHYEHGLYQNKQLFTSKLNSQLTEANLIF